MKKTILSIFLILLLMIATYEIGVYRGKYEASYFLSAVHSMMLEGTIKYIKNKEYDKAIELSMNELEASMATLDDYQKNSRDITKLPQRIILFHSYINVNQAFIEQTNKQKPKWQATIDTYKAQ